MWKLGHYPWVFEYTIQGQSMPNPEAEAIATLLPEIRRIVAGIESLAAALGAAQPSPGITGALDKIVTALDANTAAIREAQGTQLSRLAREIHIGTIVGLASQVILRDTSLVKSQQQHTNQALTGAYRLYLDACKIVPGFEQFSTDSNVAKAAGLALEGGWEHLPRSS